MIFKYAIIFITLWVSGQLWVIALLVWVLMLLVQVRLKEISFEGLGLTSNLVVGLGTFYIQLSGFTQSVQDTSLGLCKPESYHYYFF